VLGNRVETEMFVTLAFSLLGYFGLALSLEKRSLLLSRGPFLKTLPDSDDYCLPLLHSLFLFHSLTIPLLNNLLSRLL
jgi:hypothetical protein